MASACAGSGFPGLGSICELENVFVGRPSGAFHAESVRLRQHHFPVLHLLHISSFGRFQLSGEEAHKGQLHYGNGKSPCEHYPPGNKLGGGSGGVLRERAFLFLDRSGDFCILLFCNRGVRQVHGGNSRKRGPQGGKTLRKKTG